MSDAVHQPPVATPGTFTLDRATAERLTGGHWHGASERVVLRGACLDNRAVRPGCLFACIVGARVDGHQFAPAAVRDGAALILATRELSLDVPVLVVREVAQALAALAAEYRVRHRGAVWIAVAGSNGKTTTKELIASACTAHAATHATAGNLNNHLGLPVTVLNTPENVRYAVIELGANHPGENGMLARVVAASVGVVTSVGSDHLEGFGSILGVARASAEVFAELPSDGTAVLGLHGLLEGCRAFGESPEDCLAALRGSGRAVSEVGGPNAVDGEVLADGVLLRTAHGTARLALLGQHNLVNVAVAFRAATAAGVPAEVALRGLAAMRPVAGRLVSHAAGPHTVLDDSYNANPASMLAGLAVLAARPGRRLAVLGHMGELGVHAEAGNRQVGQDAAQHGLPLITVGAAARSIGTAYRAAGGDDHEHHDDVPSAAAAVLQRLVAGPTTVLVKASRSAGLERIVERLTSAYSRTPTP